jgi:hypothetical protein
MYEARTDRPAQHERDLNVIDISSMSRSGLVPTWVTRISWGSVFAGVFVATGIQFALTALSIWANFGLGKLTSVAAISSSATTTAVWIGLSAMISLFVGGIVASRLSNSTTVRSGLWHGITVWGIGTTLMTTLSFLGVSGLLGFGLSSSAAVKAVTGASSTAAVGLSRVASGSAKYAGYYLLFTVVAAGTAGVGAYIGTFGQSRRSMRSSRMGEVESEAETTTRRAA